MEGSVYAKKDTEKESDTPLFPLFKSKRENNQEFTWFFNFEKRVNIIKYYILHNKKNITIYILYNIFKIRLI